ncbi:MAG: hypothetical protein QW272_05330 [Candidatus Methanomethylicaceae archaeon]
MSLKMKTKLLSLRIRESDIEIIMKAKEYCKEKGISFGRLVADALNFYLNKDKNNDLILKEIEFLRNEIFDIKQFLKSSRITFEEKKITIEKEIEDKNLPSFLRNNPWIKILSKKGREEYE